MDRIQQASEDELRAIVLALCKDAKTERRVLAHLDKLHKLKDAQASSGTKRKATEPVFICVRCSEAFSEEENHPKACTYHGGYLEVYYDDDFWADWDENCHGIIDSKHCREEWPEGFVWDCCENIGTAPGCTKGHHYAVEGKRMKPTTGPITVSDESGDEEGSVSVGDSEDDDETEE